MREFHKRDLGQDIARSRSAVVVRARTGKTPRSFPTSIYLDSSLIGKLKKKAEGRGIG